MNKIHTKKQDLLKKAAKKNSIQSNSTTAVNIYFWGIIFSQTTVLALTYLLWTDIFTNSVVWIWIIRWHSLCWEWLQCVAIQLLIMIRNITQPSL